MTRFAVDAWWVTITCSGRQTVQLQRVLSVTFDCILRRARGEGQMYCRTPDAKPVAMPIAGLDIRRSCEPTGNQLVT